MSSRVGAQTPAIYFPPLTGTAWATTTPASLGWCQPQLDSLLAFVGRKRTDAFLMLKDGRIVVERYYGTYTADSIHYWASAGKSLTATMVGLAQQDGLLSINDSASRYVGRGWTSTTAAQERLLLLRDQLKMTTGLDDTPPAPCDNESSTPACLRYLTTPGSRWAYHTGPYHILEDVVTRATSSVSFTRYTNQRLGQRIGMAGFWYNYVFYSRARDMARFGLFILARGTWNGTPILTDQAYFQAMTMPSQTMNRSYGYLWWLNGQSSYMLPGPQQTVFPGSLIPAAPADLIAALGKNDQKIYVVPSLGLVVVRQGNSAGARTAAVSSFDNELWTRIMAAMCRPTATRSSSPAGFAAFPNPAADQLTLRQPNGSSTSIRLLDGLGRVARQEAVAGPETLLSLAALAPGLYTVQWLDANHQVRASQRVARQ
ncbi:serine hydrolase [Hymenobacter saemangeumensis]|uniref:Serine hydrolase n=2 Tax=Hymenobacter saemangeumensis TaxID=1084522 RepID=A0ABP8IIV6_9BACT